jgi:diguanylate cyclase (GGDEF)-like protein
MSQQADARPQQLGLFLNPDAQRRVDFQALCGERFGRLFVADSAEQASHILAHEGVELLIIDLEHFDRGIDLAALGALVRHRKGAPVLVVCPFAVAGWLPELSAFGPLDYAIGPVTGQALEQCIASHCRSAQAGQDGAAQEAAEHLRHLLTIRSRVQEVVVDVDDQGRLAQRICAALCNWPGVIHAAMFNATGSGEITVIAQASPLEIDLDRMLPTPLQHSPSRLAFPGLLAAGTGELSYLDAPEKSGYPELAAALRDIGAEMAVGVPILRRGPGAPLGAISLLFDRHRLLPIDELNMLADLAQLAQTGLRMEEMARDGELLLARLTELATIDALTGAANRRRGEAVLEREVKRARRYKAPLALLAFDVDHFRQINDRYGHPCGDAALRIVGTATQATLRDSDLLARSGGNEFLIVAAHTSAIDGLKMAEKIRQAIAHTVFPGCDRLTISLSVAELAEEESADGLMLRASAALARAKRAGRNCVELAMQ